MEYKQSSIFSDNQKIDRRNLCLYISFKNEKMDSIFKLLKLIEKDFIKKFEEDFVFDMEYDEEPITAKSLHKKFSNIGDNASKTIHLLYDAILKNDQISNRSDYRELITKKMFMDEWDMKAPKLEYDLNDVESIKNYIVNNIQNDKVDYIGEPTPQDIGFNFRCEYIKKSEEIDTKGEEIDDDFGYFGALNFNISGYILDYDFKYFTNYLKNFVKDAGSIFKSLSANIFVSERNFKTEYFNLFETELIDPEDMEDEEVYINHHRYGFLGGVEGINFISKDLFDEIDKQLLDDEFFEVEELENGVFINVNKDLEKVDIHDKYRVREVLDNILIKGYSDHDLIHFMEFLGKVPIYMDEIFLVESLDNEVREDLYNRYFVVTKNRDVEGSNLNSDKFRVHRFK